MTCLPLRLRWHGGSDDTTDSASNHDPKIKVERAGLFTPPAFSPIFFLTLVSGQFTSYVIQVNNMMSSSSLSLCRKMVLLALWFLICFIAFWFVLAFF